MPTRPSLLGLLGLQPLAWPSHAVREHTGHVESELPDPTPWLSALDDSVVVRGIRTGASADRAAAELDLGVEPGAGFLTYPGGWPFVIASMPDVELRVQPYTQAARTCRMFVSAGDTGPEVLIEGLPVEIRLPTGLVTPHPDEPGDPLGGATIVVGEFEPGRLDDLKVIYRQTEPTSIFVHLRVFVNDELDVDLQPAVPISFGRCGLSEIPCRAVHDFRLIPSPRLARDRIEWLRHSIEPWLPGHTSSYDGLFAVRTVDVDASADGMRDVTEFLNDHSPDPHPAAEFVLGDLVVPFHGPFWLPVPRHATVGIRRNVIDPTDKEQVYAFDRAPVHVHLFADPKLAFNVESFFYRSMPAEDLAEDLGLTFEAAIVWGEDASPNNALGLSLEPEYTFLATYRRDFGPDGIPAAGEVEPKKKLNELLHVELAGALIVDIMGFQVGLSIARRFGKEKKSILDSGVATFDAFVSLPPTGKDTSWFHLRGLNGEKIAFAIEGVGWRLGTPHFEGISLPDGVAAHFGPVRFTISELGLVAEQGASYVVFSGGLQTPLPWGTKGGLSVRRLRTWMSGDPTQPRRKLDGLFLRLQGPSFLAEAGGYYTSLVEQDGTSVTEYGFTGTVDFTVGPRHHRLGVDIVKGERSSTTEHFGYFMFSAFYAGQIGPIGGFELRSARFLYADDMVPKLVPPAPAESRELRYFRWYRESDPLTVPGDRRLAAWKPSEDSWAIGVGASASFVGFGKLVELDAFVLVVRGPEERGTLIVARLFLMSNIEPLGYLAIEIDKVSGRTSAVLAIDATLDKFMRNAPKWMAEAGGFTGTLFLSNDPCTVAIGRLADQSTWLALRFDVDVFVKASLTIGFCLELVEGGPKGFGLVVRLDGLIGKKGFIALTFHAEFGAVVMIFTTGSSDYSAAVWIQAGIRFTLFGFLRIGVSARLDFRVVGARPARAELTGEIRLETPWWLPDVTWRLDAQSGTLAPARLSTAAPPVRGAAATEPGSGRQLAAHLERFDPSWDGTGVAPVVSVEQLRAPARPESQRLANLAANTALRPIATDATISIEWSVPINDTLGLAAGIATGAGDQLSGDLALRYDLVRVSVRRRARFGADRAWKDLDDRIELVADFSDPGGVQLGGEFAPQVLSATWDVDLRADGGPVAKKLLVNAVAPYEFATADAELDEQLIHRLPSWPCCAPLDDKTLHDLFHRVSWRQRLAGTALGMPASSRFSDSASTLRFPRPAWTHAAGFGGLPPATVVSAAEIVQPGIVARADLDEDAAFCSVRVAWPRGALLTLVAFDGSGNEVARRELGTGSAAFVTTLFGAQGPIRRIEIRTFRPPASGVSAIATSSVGTLVEVDEVTYVGLRDYLDLLRAQAACGDGGGHGGYEGRGKLGLLPNHEYELRLTTRVTVAHPSAAEESADVDEFVYVRTKGLPGLNAVERVGEEIEPYVRGAYAGGRAGLVYRSEPVTLAFSEDFHVAVPLAVRPPGTATEHTVLQTMQLLVTPEVALRAATEFTATGTDWIVAHLGAGIPPVRGPRAWHPTKSGSHSAATPMVSVNPARHRLAGLTQRAAVTCGPADPRRVIGTVLVAPPQGGGSSDPAAPGSPELWPGGGRFLATVRAEHAPFVDRRPFDPGDETALSRSGGPWTVVDGRLQVEGSGAHVAVLGDPDWDHLSIAVSVSTQQRAGVGFALAGASALGRGIFAEIVGTRLVVSARASTGGALVELDADDLLTSADELRLEVTVFDDRLRASVGDVVVEVDRGELRAGRMGLVADGPATFGSLQVHGLDMYRFPFGVSRYRSFEAHLASWDGVIAVVAPDATGPGTTTSTVAQLWAQTSADVAAVMATSAPPAERERVFGAWVAALGLPLTDDVTDVRVSRFVVGGRTEALLVESPEPLDFTEEIAVSASRRQRTGSLPPHRHDPIGPAGTVRERLIAAALRPSLEPTRGRRPGIDATILDADVVGDALQLSLHPALAGAGMLAVAAVDDAGRPQLFRGRVRPGLTSTSPAILPAAHVGALPALPPHSELAPSLQGAPAGTILLASADLALLLGRHRLQPAEVDVDVPVEVIQSGDGRRALVVTASGEAFAAGTHRLRFALVRRRWDTTDPADELNTCSGEATWHLAL